MPMAQGLQNLMLGETLDVKVINLLKSLAKALGFEDTLFVSSAGDNSDGSSWIKAYTSITPALDWVASNQSSGQFHLIMVGAGSFDIDTTGDPTYDKNIAIVGMGKSATVLTNTASGATSILNFTGILICSNLTIDTGAGSVDGIVISGTGANGSQIKDCEIDSAANTGAQDCIRLAGGVDGVHIDDCHIKGAIGFTTGILTNNAIEAHLHGLEIDTCLIGISLTNAADDNIHMNNLELDNNALGINIALAAITNTAIVSVHFFGNTDNINDEGTDTELASVVYDNLIASIFPADLIGIELTAGVGANTWSAAAVEVRSAAAATKPFFITGIKLEPNAIGKWGIRLYEDGGTTPFYETLLDLRGGGANILQPEDLVAPYEINQGKQISATAKSETGGDDIDIWLALEVI